MNILKIVLLTACLLVSGLTQARYSHDKETNVATINGVELAYVVAGEVDATPIVLIMGLTASHRLWNEAFVQGLVDAGYRVVLFDNRDTGDSERLDRLGEPTIWWEMLKNVIGIGVDAPYTLNDMAADTVGVMDELGIKRAHVVGASMGGMIAQVVAAEYPGRARSLVSIMSTTGAPHLPDPEEQAAADLQGLGDAEGDGAAQMEALGIYPEAMPRQLLAIVAAGDRSEQVQSIAVPTLVQHGAQDTLLPPPHGAHTAELIGDAKYVVYDDMGHNLPDEVVPLLVKDIVAHIEAAE
ncbi:MAG: alpha/beta fold hydrolase [Pseudomonadales bacterium]|nr:alpha/beta fold hydrolase [Pseudomonadales bacterium]